MLVLDGYIEIGPHLCSEIDNLIWLRLFLSAAVANLKLIFKKTFLNTFATCSQLPSNISTKLGCIENAEFSH